MALHKVGISENLVKTKHGLNRASTPTTPDTASFHAFCIFYQVMDRKNLQKVAINPETWVWQIKNGMANQD